MDKYFLNKQLNEEKLKELENGKVQTSPMEEIPMSPAPLSELTPEQAAELDRKAKIEALSGMYRNPASEKPSVQDLTSKSDMIAAPLEEYAPEGSFVGGKLGQQVSPDVSGEEQVQPEDKLAQLRALLQKR